VAVRGHRDGRGVLPGAIVAFLIPILVFIGTVAAVSEIFGFFPVDTAGGGALAFLSGAAAVIMWVPAGRFFARRP